MLNGKATIVLVIVGSGERVKVELGLSDFAAKAH